MGGSIGSAIAGCPRRVFSTRIRSGGLPSDTQGRSRMRECRSYGSARGAGSDARPYRDLWAPPEHGMIQLRRSQPGLARNGAALGNEAPPLG